MLSIRCTIFLLCAQGCYLSHQPESVELRLAEPPPGEGRALLSNDDDWFRPGPTTRGDPTATSIAIEWLEQGLDAPRIQICGTLPELDLSIAGWRDYEPARDREIRAQLECGNELRTLLADRDIVLLEYVSSAWGSDTSDWTDDDFQAARDFFDNGGRVVILDDLGRVTPFFQLFGVDPVTLATDSYDSVTYLDVADGDGLIGQAAFLTGAR